MANRTLAYHDDGTLTEQRDGELGYEGAHSVLRIERSAAGAPGLFFIIEDHHGGGLSGETSVYIEDGAAFLAPVIGWLNGNDPEPWSVGDPRDGRALRSAVEAIGPVEWCDFDPRPGYNQNREDYS